MPKVEAIIQRNQTNTQNAKGNALKLYRKSHKSLNQIPNVLAKHLK